MDARTHRYQGELDILIKRQLRKAGLRDPFNTDSIKKGANRAMDISHNVKRPHIGHTIKGKTPLGKIQELGYNIDKTFAMFQS